MNIGGGRSGSPSGRLLGHSSIGSASSSRRPPRRTHRSSATRSSAGCASGCAISRSLPFASSAVGDADRNDAIARLERFQGRRTAALQREILAEHQRQARQQQQCRPLLLPAAAGSGARSASASRATAAATAPSATMQSANSARRARAAHFFVAAAVVCRVGRARRNAELGQRLARFVGRGLLRAHCMSSRLDRLMIDAKQDDEKGEREARQSDANALRAAAGRIAALLSTKLWPTSTICKHAALTVARLAGEGRES